MTDGIGQGVDSALHFNLIWNSVLIFVVVSCMGLVVFSNIQARKAQRVAQRAAHNFRVMDIIRIELLDSLSYIQGTTTDGNTKTLAEEATKRAYEKLKDLKDD